MRGKNVKDWATDDKLIERKRGRERERRTSWYKCQRTGRVTKMEWSVM